MKTKKMRKVLVLIVLLLVGILLASGCTPVSSGGEGGGGTEGGTNPGEDGTRLEAPSRFGYTDRAYHSIFLTWAYMETSGASWLTRFKVYVSSATEEYSLLTPVIPGSYKGSGEDSVIKVVSNRSLSKNSHGKAIADNYFQLTGLADGTRYTVSVTAVKVDPDDVNIIIEGSESSRATFSFNTKVAPDTTPPADISALTVEYAQSGLVKLSWTNPTGDDFHKLTIRRKEGSAPTGPDDGEFLISSYVTGSISYLNPYDSDGGLLYLYTGEIGGITSFNDGKQVYGFRDRTQDNRHTEYRLKQDGTAYYYSIFASDRSGNYSQGVSVRAVPEDTISPVSPNSFLPSSLKNLSHTKFFLRFSLPRYTYTPRVGLLDGDFSGSSSWQDYIAKARLYRDGLLIHEFFALGEAECAHSSDSTGFRYIDDNLSPNTTYGYEISYVDNYGNESERGDFFEVTTLSDETRVYVANYEWFSEGITGYTLLYEDSSWVTVDLRNALAHPFKILGDFSPDSFRIFALSPKSINVNTVDYSNDLGDPPFGTSFPQFGFSPPYFGDEEENAPFFTDACIDTQKKIMYVCAQVDLGYGIDDGGGFSHWEFSSKNVIYALGYAPTIDSVRINVLDVFILEDAKKTENQSARHMLVDPPVNIVQVGELLYTFMGNSGRVFTVNTLTGVISEYDLRDEQGQPLGSTNIRDVEVSSVSGNFYVADIANHCIYVIDPVTLSVIHTFGPSVLGENFNPYGLDEDVDTGNLWVANSYGVDGESNRSLVLDPSNTDNPVLHELIFDGIFMSADSAVDTVNRKAYFSHPENSVVSIVDMDNPGDHTIVESNFGTPFRITVLEPQNQKSRSRK